MSPPLAHRARCSGCPGSPPLLRWTMTSPRVLRPSLLLLCLLAVPLAAFAGPAAPPLPAIPARLEVPANQTLFLTVAARGAQIYECRAVQGDPSKFEWTLKAPEADLFDAGGNKVGRHYAGPTWELKDGGKVAGHLKAKADAPDGKGVPWLLLEAASPGEGTLNKVRSIQRVGTVGGKAPTEPADQSKAGQERRVEYSATYLFYAGKP